MTLKGRRAYGSKVKAKNPRLGDDHPMRANPELARKGEQVNFSKLTDKAVRHIRNSKLSNIELSKIYRVIPATIHMVRIRKTWKHIK